MNINYNKIVFYYFTLLILFSLNGNNYLKYLEDNGFDTLKTIIEELAEINKENIRLKIYNENKVTKVLANFTPDYQTKLIKKIKEEYKNSTTIDFEDESIKHCFLKGIIKNENFENFSVSSDNHTSLDFFTNVLDKTYHVYLGDTIDKQRSFENKDTLERLSLALLFTHISKGLFENIINKGKNAIYCAGNHDIGWCFNVEGGLKKTSFQDKNFLKKALRLTNFIECIIFSENSIFNFNHGAGKSRFEKKIYIIDEDNKKIYFAIVNQEEPIDSGAKGDYDINGTWCGPHNILLENHIPMFRQWTVNEYKSFFENKEEEKQLHKKTYYKFFGHAHPVFLEFKKYFLNSKKISLNITTSKDKKNSMVFLPPSHHDNEFSDFKFFEQYANNNPKRTYSFSSLSTEKIEQQEIKINPPENQMFKKIPNKKQDQNSHIKSSLTGLALGTGIGGGITLWNKNHEFAKNKFHTKKYLLVFPIIGLAAGYGYGKYCQKFLEKK